MKRPFVALVLALSAAGLVFSQASRKPDTQGDTLTTKWIRTYGAAGVLAELDEYNGDGSLAWKLVRGFDARGVMAEETYYKSDGSPDSKVVYENDPAGNWVKKTRQVQVTTFGQTYWEPSGEAEYRTIEYYQ